MTTGDLTTLASVKAWFSPPLTTTADDALLARLITAASAFLTAWLNRQLLTAPYTATFNGNGKTALLLPQYPITAVQSLTIDGQTIPPLRAGASAAAAGYTVDATTLYLSGTAFNRGVQNVTVAWTAGYASVPPDIEQACIDLVALRYRERDRIGLASKGMAGETTSYSQRDLPANAATLLQVYRRVAPL